MANPNQRFSYSQDDQVEVVNSAGLAALGIKPIEAPAPAEAPADDPNEPPEAAVNRALRQLSGRPAKP